MVLAPTWESKSTAELPLDPLIQTYGCKASKAAQNLNVWHQEGHQLHGLLQREKQHCQRIWCQENADLHLKLVRTMIQSSNATKTIDFYKIVLINLWLLI